MKPEDIATLKLILSRYVITVGGRYSRGKSLLITALGFFDIILNNRNKFLSNMPINYDNMFPDKQLKYTPLVQTSQFDNMERDTAIFIDEIQQLINARNSSSTNNKFLTIFQRDVAKLNNRIFGSFQFGDTIDKVFGLAVEIIIIPDYYKKYSKDITEDNIQRIEHQDFRMNLTIYDKRDGDKYYISGEHFNLYPIIFMYNTKFKMDKLFLDHRDYVAKLKPMERERFNDIKDYEVKERVNNWHEGLKEIGKINIR